MKIKTKLEKKLIGSSIFIILSIIFILTYIYFALFITKNLLGVFLSEIYLVILYLIFYLIIFPTYYKKSILGILMILSHKTDKFFKQCEKLLFKGFKYISFKEFINILFGIYSIGLTYFLVASILSLITFPLMLFSSNFHFWSFDLVIKAILSLPFLILFLSVLFLFINRFIIWLLQKAGVIKK